MLIVNVTLITFGANQRIVPNCAQVSTTPVAGKLLTRNPELEMLAEERINAQGRDPAAGVWQLSWGYGPR